MKIKFKEIFKDVREKEIDGLEKDLEISLPSEYKKFLLKNNGGRPYPCLFKTIEGEYESDIQYFFGITDDNYSLTHNYNILKGRFLNGYLPIAIDSLGNFVIIDCKSGKVYFLECNLYQKILIAESFENFLNCLYENKENLTELDQEIDRQNLIYFKRIIDSGVHVDDIRNEFNQPITIISSMRNKLNLLKFFIEKGAHFEGALYAACSSGNIEIVSYLLAIGVDPNERNIEQNNETPLIQASFAGYLDIVKLLIQRGADVNATDIYDQSALVKAYWSNNQSLITYFENEVYK